MSDPDVVFEGQGPGGHNRDFVVQGQSPSYYCVRDRNIVGREQPIDLDPFGPSYHVDSGASAGLCYSPLVVRAQSTAGMAYRNSMALQQGGARPDQSRNQKNGNSIPRGKCFSCGQPGHYRNACPRSKKTQSKSESEQQETSQPNERTVTRKGLWLVPGTIEGVKVEMLVVSGSDRALVNSKFYNSTPAAARPRLGPSTWSVDTTLGSPIVAIGEADFQL